MGKVIGLEEISVGGSPVGLSPLVYIPSQGNAAAQALISAEGGDMRYRLDGIDPTASTGHLLVDANFLKLDEMILIKNFRVIQAAVDPGKLTVSYES